MYKTLLLAAALSLGSISAFANGSDGGGWSWSVPRAATVTHYQAPQQQAPRSAIGHSDVYFSTTPNQGLQYNPNFGSGGEG